jgi:plastocyanin
MTDVVRVEVKDLSFSAPEITARVGDTEWVNVDFIAHTATEGQKLGGDETTAN